MPAEPAITALEVARVERRHQLRSKVLGDYWALTKPEVNFLIAITTFAGFYLGCPSQPFPFMLLFHTLLGTLPVAGGTGTLNQYIERHFDAQMRRTARRPLASGRIESSHALWFGISLSLVGTVYLALAVGGLACLLAAVTLLSYLFLYTPLKRKTPLCMLVGAVPANRVPSIFSSPSYWVRSSFSTADACFQKVERRGATTARRFDCLSACRFSPDDSG
jgi:protoheme IX farnesyltransferase